MRSPLLWRRNAGQALLACLAGLLLAPAPAVGEVYFSALFAQGGSGLERAGFDGTQLEAVQFQPSGFADGIALDPLHGKVYWTDTNASVIWSANMNGSGAQIVLDDFGAEPLGIALDVAGGKMYWTDSAGVKRAALNGSGAELLNKGPARGFIALDLAAQRAYWADWPSGTIKTASISPEAPVTNLITKQLAPFGVALDPHGGKIYWLQLNLNRKKGEKEVIRRANVDGSEAQTLLERPGAGFEGGLAIDPAAGKLYWSEAESHDIAVASLDGSHAQALFGTGADSPVGLAIETSNPRPVNTAAPRIEGTAAVGRPLSCDPGAWTGTGPLSFAYQWGILGASAIEGGPAFVAPTEDANSLLECVVTATDNVQSSTATSAAVTLAPSLGEGAATPPPPASSPAPLIAGIALSRLTVSGASVRVPVFTSFAGRATLWAIPSRWPRRAHEPGGRRGTPAKGTVSASRQLSAGRGAITLRGLHPHTTYRLVLIVTSLAGESARDTATLRVR
jgi:low-density lipoprotein receptor class B